MPEKPAVDLVYFDAGGGHRSAATALQSVLVSPDWNWDARLVNLQEVLDSLDIFRKLTGIRLQDIYNLVLAKNWTLGSAQLLRAMHAVIRVYHPAQVRVLTAFWRARRPDLAVSLVPNFNRALFQSLQRAVPGTAFVTVLTDLADYPPHFWMERQPQYLICGTRHAVKQAAAMGYSESRVFQTSGMILRPQFYDLPTIDRAEERRLIGLAVDVPTGLLLFGGAGSNAMQGIAERLGNSAVDVQLIVLCGRNAKLRQRLQMLRARNKIVVEGFTTEVPRYMQLCDFFIGKPGPGSISEALHMGLPVIVEKNAWTLPQERYNADWIREQGVGIVLRSFRNIESAVRDLLAGDHLQRMKARAGALQNRALFEIPPVLEHILNTSNAR